MCVPYLKEFYALKQNGKLQVVNVPSIVMKVKTFSLNQNFKYS